MVEGEPLAGSKKASATAEEVTYTMREEYFNALQKWLQDAYAWQATVSCLPHMIPGAAPGMAGPPLSPGRPGDNIHPPLLTDPLRPPPIFVVPPAPAPGVRINTPAHPPASVVGTRYRVPPMWKRVCAELVDSLIMFFLKLIMTFIAVHMFSIDFEKFDMDTKFVFDKLQHNVELPYKLAYEMTSQLIILELINRFVTCMLEAYWLHKGEGGHIGGATPGKSLLGLRVVLCNAVQPVNVVPGQPQEIVVVSPGIDLGWQWALARSVCKNLSLAFVYPICFAFFFFQHNRTAYDMLCHSIVVESPQNRQ